MSRLRLFLVALIALALQAPPARAAAQSLLNASGLGLPIEPLDARSRGLGGVPVGLFGASVLPTDPVAGVVALAGDHHLAVIDGVGHRAVGGVGPPALGVVRTGLGDDPADGGGRQDAARGDPRRSSGAPTRIQTTRGNA